MPPLLGSGNGRQRDHLPSMTNPRPAIESVRARRIELRHQTVMSGRPSHLAKRAWTVSTTCADDGKLDRDDAHQLPMC